MVGIINKRGAEENTSTIVKVVIILAVIFLSVLIIILLLKPELLYKFGNLPDYQTSQEDRLVEVESGQEAAMLCNDKPGKTVATIKDDFFVGTRLYISKSSWGFELPGGSLQDYKYIRYSVNWGPDEHVASIVNNRIVVIDGVSEEVMSRIKGQLDILNGAYFKTSNSVCKQN